MNVLKTQSCSEILSWLCEMNEYQTSTMSEIYYQIVNVSSRNYFHIMSFILKNTCWYWLEIFIDLEVMFSNNSNLRWLGCHTWKVLWIINSTNECWRYQRITAQRLSLPQISIISSYICLQGRMESYKLPHRILFNRSYLSDNIPISF